MAQEESKTGLSNGSQAEPKKSNLTGVLIVLNLAFAAILMYILSIFFAYPVFQSTRITDPLAEINSLSPLYFIAIVITALLIAGCVLWRIGNRYLHIFLLMLFAVMLWLTPYLLTSFVRLGDSAWHTGVAMSIPRVLDGEAVSFSAYSWAFPGSYIFHYSIIQILGIHPLTYITIYPLFCLLLFVLLTYLLIGRLFNQRVALLALLLAIPGLHYLQLHTSPHTIGALLMLTALLLLVQKGTSLKIMPLVLLLTTIVIVSHPTTPLLLSIFVAAALVTDVIYSRRLSRRQALVASVFLLCFVGWFAWYSYYPSPSWINKGASGLLGSLNPEGAGTTGEYLTGTTFIYTNIYRLNQAIYFLYGAAGLLGLIFLAAAGYSREQGFRKWILNIGGIKRSEACIAVSVLPLFLLTVLLAEKAHDLIETGLTYLILTLSCIIASAAIRSRWIDKKITSYAVVIAVLFLTISYPVVAYSIDAYSNFPRSERFGVEFLDSKVPLDGKTINGNNISQLALYDQAASARIKTVRYYRGHYWEADIAVMRNTGYYYSAMRFARSFDDNGYTKYLEAIEEFRYNKIYASPTFSIYLNNAKE